MRTVTTARGSDAPAYMLFGRTEHSRVVGSKRGYCLSCISSHLPEVSPAGTVELCSSA